MSSLVYSLNATIPVFLVMVVGYLLKQIGMINDEFVRSANKFNFRITLPALLFKDIIDADIMTNFDMKYVVFCAIVTLICICLIWGIAKLTYRNPDRGEFVQGAYRGSAAVLGAAFIQNIYGNSGMAPLMIIGSVPIYNIFAVIVLTFENGDHRESGRIKKAFTDICKNPIILAIIVGMLVSCMGVNPPKIIDNTIGMLAKMASPLALITIGAGFEGRKAIARIKPTLAATFIKLIAQPIVFMPLAVYMGFRGDKLIALLIMLGAPSTASGYIMAKNMNHEGVLSSSIIVLTTVLSSFSITAGLFVLKYLGYV